MCSAAEHIGRIVVGFGNILHIMQNPGGPGDGTI
jgi:hypothetical protein